MEQYFCIFQSGSTQEVTNNTSKVLTVTGCICHGYCPSNTYETRPGTEGLNYIQEQCAGHRLKSNTITTKFPDIKQKTITTAEIYNKLKEIITTEFNNRKKSPLYSSVNVTEPESVSNKKLILKSQVDKLNKYIATSTFYKDTTKIPTFSQISTGKVINSSNFQETTNAIVQLLKDCICYSDCNGYSTCTCFGNCNHY